MEISSSSIKGIHYVDIKSKLYKSCIDHILASSYLLGLTYRACIKLAPTPDHKAVLLKINTHPNNRGLRYKILNYNLLKEKMYCKNIADIFKKTTGEYSMQTYKHSI